MRPLGVFGLVVGLAFASPGSAQTANPAPATAQAYRIGVNDQVEVDVLGRTDFKTRARVGDDGAIRLPLIGAVQAANSTAAELRQAVERALKAGGFYANPIVTVEVTAFESRTVTVLGAVNRQDLITLDRPYRLSEVIARVGGLTPKAENYVLVTSAVGAEKRYTFQELSTGASDPVLAAGDKIFVPQIEEAAPFYVDGQVRAPGPHPIKGEMTFRMAIAAAGGLTPLGSDRRIQVERNGEKIKNLDLNQKVQPGDVIFVGQRLF